MSETSIGKNLMHFTGLLGQHTHMVHICTCKQIDHGEGETEEKDWVELEMEKFIQRIRVVCWVVSDHQT